MTKPYGLAIHGGAGMILKENMTSEVETPPIGPRSRRRWRRVSDVLRRAPPPLTPWALRSGSWRDSPLFNAARGAAPVLNAEGLCELDAAIMDGRTLAAGAVAGLQHVKNPIDLARAVMWNIRRM